MREESRGKRPGDVAEKVRVFLLNYMTAIAVQPQRRLFGIQFNRLLVSSRLVDIGWVEFNQSFDQGERFWFST